MKHKGELMLTLCGAIEAEKLINHCFVQALEGLAKSIMEGNINRKKYWLERLIHLMNELNWIDKTIQELKAAASEANPPTRYPE